jgi:RecA-family ATPase
MNEPPEAGPFTGVSDDATTWINPPPGTEEAREKQRPNGPDDKVPPQKDIPDGQPDHPDDLNALPSNFANYELPVVGFNIVRASDRAKLVIPQMRWFVQDWMPAEQVTGIYGVGGSLKTRLLLQGLMAKARGLAFLGYMLDPAPTLGLFCEDTQEHLDRLMAEIAAFYEVPLSEFRDFICISLVGVDDTELVNVESAKLIKTELLRRVDYLIERHGIKGVGLDTIAHFFGGDEIRRRDVTRFMRVLDGISTTRKCAFIFTAHPSVRGKNTGSMDSGSTGWEAGTRSRLSWRDPAANNNGDGTPGADPDTVIRHFTRVKSNHAKPGEVLELVLRNGGFIPTAVDPEAARTRHVGAARDAACDTRFLQLLAETEGQGRHVHDRSNNPSHYAPLVFHEWPVGEKFSAPEYTRAMRRLFVAKRIRVAEIGPPSRRRSQLTLITWSTINGEEPASPSSASSDPSSTSGDPSGKELNC